MPLYLASRDKADLNKHLNNRNVNMLILNRDAKVAYLCTKHLIVWVHKCANCVQNKKKYARMQCTIHRLKTVQKIQCGTMDISHLQRTAYWWQIWSYATNFSQSNANAGHNNAQLDCKCHRIAHVFALNTTIYCYQTVITDCGYLIQTAICLNQAFMLQRAFGSCHLQLVCWSCRRDAFKKKKGERRRGR